MTLPNDVNEQQIAIPEAQISRLYQTTRGDRGEDR